MMHGDMPRIEVTLREFADELGLSVETIRGWSKTRDDFPEGRKVGPVKLYALVELRAWRRRHPTLGLGRGGHRRKPERP